MPSIAKELQLLTEALQNKKKYLQLTYETTLIQADILNKSTVDLDKFDQTLQQKEEYIIKIEKYDTGFEALYNKINYELKANMAQYKYQIQSMQSYIKEMTELAVKIKNAELKNKQALDLYLSKQRKEISSVHKRQTITSAYDKVMRGQMSQEAFFMDKKK